MILGPVHIRIRLLWDYKPNSLFISRAARCSHRLKGTVSRLEIVFIQLTMLPAFPSFSAPLMQVSIELGLSRIRLLLELLLFLTPSVRSYSIFHRWFSLYVLLLLLPPLISNVINDTTTSDVQQTNLCKVNF